MNGILLLLNEGGITSIGNGNGKSRRSIRHVRKDSWCDAEKSWLLVEKKLRINVQNALNVRPEMITFVEAFEAILMYFAEKLSSPPANIIPSSLSSLLASPLTVKTKLRKSRSSSSSSKTESETEIKTETETETETQSTIYSLRVHVQASGGDSAFYRLLIHATSQFYGFKSASITENDGARVTTVTAPMKITAKKTPMIQSSISLAGFLTIGQEETLTETVKDTEIETETATGTVTE